MKCQKANMFSRMWPITYTILILLSSQLFYSTDARAKKTKSVTTLLDAKWEVTPLILEVAEYLADENVNFFWTYIDQISALKSPPVDISM